MKRLITLSAIATLALLMVAGPAPAQNQRPRGQGQRASGDRMRRRPQQFNMARFRQLVGQLDLTAEQKEKVAKLSKDYEKKVADQRKETAAKIEGLRAKQKEARQEKDKDKLAELRKEFGQLRGAGVEAAKGYVASVKKVLTEEQNKKLEQLQKPVPGIPLLLQAIKGKGEELKLTEEQQKKIHALAEEYKPAEGEGRPADFRALREKTRQMREDGESQEDIRKVYQEAQKKRTEQMAKMQKRSREFTAKLGKILEPEQMKVVMETARANMGQRMRSRGRDRQPGGQRQRRGGRGDGQE